MVLGIKQIAGTAFPFGYSGQLGGKFCTVPMPKSSKLETSLSMCLLPLSSMKAPLRRGVQYMENAKVSLKYPRMCLHYSG